MSSRTPSQADQAFEALEHMLVTLELSPGQAVNEKDLVGAVGLGRTPVREAILRLADLGLLKVLPRKGLLVASIQRSELQRVLEVRRVLERLLVVKACERASRSQRRQLEEFPERLRMVAATRDLSAFFQLDRGLDAILSAASGNHYLVSALAPLQVHCRRLWFYRRQELDLREAAERHAGLAAAVFAGDGAAAVRSVNGVITELESQLQALDNLA